MSEETVSSTEVPATASIATGQQLSTRHGHVRWYWDVAVCVLTGLASFLIYQANMRSIPAVDTYAARYLPLSIWHHHTVALDAVAPLVAQGREIATSESGGDVAWWIRKGRDNHLFSFYPILVPVVVTPLYRPAVTYLDRYNWDPLLLDSVARLMEKLSASFLASLSVMLLYLLMRRRCGIATAALLAAVFALGTTTWVISSQALWMHGLGTLLIVATLLFLTGPSSAWRAVSAGFLCSLIVCNRQPDIVLAAGLGLYGLWWAGRRAPLFVAAALVPASLMLAYNVMFVGHVLGGYGLVSQARLSSFLSPNVLAGVAGLLFSPTHGLFVFSPFLLFVPCGLRSVLRDRETRGLTLVIGAAALIQVVLYGFGDWRQGMSWGPRWLTDMLPILFWMLPPVLAGFSSLGRAAFGVACGVAIAIQAIGAFWYTGASDAAVLAGTGANAMRAAWSLRNAPFIAELKHRRPGADLFVDLQGNIDLVAVSDATGDKTRRQVEVHGWALTNHESPSDIAIRVDGRVMAGTSDLFERPDVVQALAEKRPAGWRVAFLADQIAPGEHTVTAMVRAHEGGEPRLLKTRTFTLARDGDRDRELQTAAQRATSVIIERQQTSGYWLTEFTGAPRYEKPGQELNTFTNAVMIDVAGPVAEVASLSGALARARTYLTNQIEAGGLVRYHGRPDAPTIGTLGCAITPDADDTALVWRVAPGIRTDLRQKALATVAQFRTADGLYRTWLAPRERYQCLDPGQDPNPADMAIQIHMLMLLAQVDQPAARGLCTAIQKRSADDAVWVYYKMAPLLMTLRQTDLRQIGCPIAMPPARLQTTVPGQDVWVEAVVRLQRIESGDRGGASYSDTADLLRTIAAHDFALLASNPPLLYHNDLTGTVPRFYWSKEFGYALWLRLYVENERASARQK